MNYEKITKWSLVGLLLIGVFFSVYGFIVGWPADEQKWDESLHFPVDLILWGGYIFAAITLLAVIFGVVVVGGMNSPKSLLKLGIGIVAIVVIVLFAVILSPNAKESAADLPLALKDQLLANGGQEALDGSLRLTDAMLNLTYLLGGGALTALVAGWIIGLTRK